MQTNSCDARSYAKNPPPRFHKVGDVDGRRLRFCGRVAKGYSGAPSSPLRRKNGSVLYASNYSLAAPKRGVGFLVFLHCAGSRRGELAEAARVGLRKIKPGVRRRNGG